VVEPGPGIRHNAATRTEDDMANRGLFIGLGCLVLVVIVGVIIGAVALFSGASMPSKVVLALTLDGPIVEIAAEDPFAELTGSKVTSLRDVRRALVLAADDDRVVGLRVRVNSAGGGFATLQELRTLIQRVSAAGKWTDAYIDTAGEFTPGNGVYYLASACDSITMHPAGDINLLGLGSRTPFIAGMFEKLGVEAEFPGRGPYKTARFMYTEKDFTPEQREMMQWILGSIQGQMVEGIASARGKAPQEIQDLMDQGPHLGDEALSAGLVDRLEDWTDFRARIISENENAKALSVGGYLERNPAPAMGNRIAVVTGVGAIMRGANRQSFNPLFGGDVMGSETIARAWRDVRDAKGIKAAIFRIDSPGGSALASEIMRREMIRTAEDIPVVVSMSNLAASGGYWISCGAQRIVASPATLTGSIGVFAGHLNTDRFWADKLGITYGRMDLARNANLYGDLESWNDEQRAIADRLLDRIYDDFLERVASSRNMTTDEVHAIAEGRVWTGAQALERGLVDAVGGFDVALDHARELAGLDADADVALVDFPKSLPWWQQMLEQQQREEVAMEQVVRTLNDSIHSGRIETPGVVWMPPIIVE
jgi:protease-4